MHLNQSFDAVKTRLGLGQLTQVGGVNQGPRHTIDAILGLNGTRQMQSGRGSSDYGDQERECDAMPASPGALESAGMLINN